MPRFTQRHLLPLAIAVAAGLVLQAALGAIMGVGMGALIIGGILTLLLAVGVAWAMLTTDATLIRQLVEIIVQIENGQHPEGVTTQRNDELGDLTKAVFKLTNRDKAVQQANSDALTGLANRRGILQKLDGAFKAKKELALFYIDLDKFKPVNDQYGHEMGDAVLKRVAELFQACVREGDVVARLGGDEFLILFYGLTDPKLLEERAQKILDIVSEPMWVNDTRIKIGASIGITVAPKDGATVEAIMNAGDETMYAVKKAGRNGFKFYS